MDYARCIIYSNQCTTVPGAFYNAFNRQHSRRKSGTARKLGCVRARARGRCDEGGGDILLLTVHTRLASLYSEAPRHSGTSKSSLGWNMRALKINLPSEVVKLSRHHSSSYRAGHAWFHGMINHMFQTAKMQIRLFTVSLFSSKIKDMRRAKKFFAYSMSYFMIHLH